MQPNGSAAYFACTLAVMLLAGGSTVCVAAVAPATGAYPSKPVRLIIPFPPGGGNDQLARIIAERLGERLSQQFVADNRGGASSIIAAEIVAKAPADGYTVMLGTSATLAVLPSLKVKLPYDPVKDFEPIVQLSNSPFLLVVHPQFPAKSVTELIALSKAKPGQINYGTPGHGTSNHLAVELFRSMSGAVLTHVPYKGTGPALADLLGGHIPMMFASTASVRSLVLSGKLRALGVSTAQRSPAMPEVPPLAESGVPGYDMASWAGLLAPRGTPSVIVAKLNAEVTAILSYSELRDKLIALGYVPQSGSAAVFADHIRAELVRFKKLVQSAGLSID